jgi:hypothetical protein
MFIRLDSYPLAIRGGQSAKDIVGPRESPCYHLASCNDAGIQHCARPTLQQAGRIANGLPISFAHYMFSIGVPYNLQVY